MARETDQDIWPMPKFYFRVSWDDVTIRFQEVSGLDTEAEPIEYRAGNSPVFSTVKMPGIVKSGNITLKKGVFAKNNTIFDWFNQVKMNTIARKPVTIALMDETGAPTMVWNVKNAFPVKVSATDWKAEGDEVAVESIEIAHEGFTISNS